jgi:hypothetical protein
MPRGSRPGERRGGRQKGTLNKNTLLRVAALTTAAANPKLSPLDYFLNLMRNTSLPIETRVAAAREALPYSHRKPPRPEPSPNGTDKYGASFSSTDGDAPAYGGICIQIANEWEPAAPKDKISNIDQADRSGSAQGAAQPTIMPLGFLLGVMRDPHTPAALGLRVARVVAPYIHTRPNAEDFEAISVDDPTGFCIAPARAVELRDLKQQLKAAARQRDSQPEQYERETTTLRARIDQINRDLEWPCPSRYGEAKVEQDEARLLELEQTRQAQKKLSVRENIEEAWLTARVASHATHPEEDASRRLSELESRRWEDRLMLPDPWKPGPPLDANEKAEWRALKNLYGRPQRCSYNAPKDYSVIPSSPGMLALEEGYWKGLFSDAV